MPEPESHSRAAIETTRAGALHAGSLLLGFIAAPLPARWRRAIPLLEQSNWPGASIPSALLQVLLCIGLFALAYVAWINHQYEAIDAAAEAAGHAGKANVEESQVMGRALMLSNPMLTLIFAFTTFQGFALLLAGLSGFARFLHCAITRDVMPDPILGITDWALALVQGKAATASRECSKDRSPDRMILGGPGDKFPLTIESAADFPWREGNTIVVASQWYRLASRSEQMTPAGLRQRYELELMPTGVAIRGLRRYDPGHVPVIENRGAQPAS